MIDRWLIGLSTTLLARVPRRPGYWLVARIADLFFVLWPRTGTIAANMERIVAFTGDDRSPRQLARQSLRNYAYYLADFFRANRLDPAELDQAIGPEDEVRLKAFIESGRGLILAGMHMGNWDYAGSLMRGYGYPFYVVTDTLRPQSLNDFVQKRRQSLGMTTIPVEQAARGLLRALRAGHTIGLLIDRPLPANEGLPIEFFGETCYLPAGAAALSLRTGAPVVPATMFREADGSYRMAFAFDLAVEPTGRPETDLQQLAQAIVQAHQGWISRRPDQWYMFRRMWNGNAQTEPAVELSLADRSV